MCVYCVRSKLCHMLKIFVEFSLMLVFGHFNLQSNLCSYFRSHHVYVCGLRILGTVGPSCPRTSRHRWTRHAVYIYRSCTRRQTQCYGSPQSRYFHSEFWPRHYRYTRRLSRFLRSPHSQVSDARISKPPTINVQSQTHNFVIKKCCFCVWVIIGLRRVIVTAVMPSTGFRPHKYYKLITTHIII